MLYLINEWWQNTKQQLKNGYGFRIVGKLPRSDFSSIKLIRNKTEAQCAFIMDFSLCGTF